MKRSLNQDHIEAHLTRGGGVLEDLAGQETEWKADHYVDEWGERHRLPLCRQGAGTVARQVWRRHRQGNTRLSLTP